jgi:CheY-like chemotaxis protein
MGGEIDVVDREGGGSIFWFEIPLQPAPDLTAPAVASATASPPEGVPAGQGRILLAEDNAINIEFATMVLESRGYAVDVAADGFEAIAAAGRGGYDLVLMDMQMPRLDGLSATRRIRALEGDRRKLPIVAMTANAMREDAIRCLEAGMDDYIAKPIDPSRLCAIVARWIEHGRERNS